VKFTKVHS